jgi:hypothetical protein
MGVGGYYSSNALSSSKRRILLYLLEIIDLEGGTTGMSKVAEPPARKLFGSVDIVAFTSKSFRKML